MTTDEARRHIATARALMRSKRYSLCRHGVAYDHCAECEPERADLTESEDQ